MNPYFILRLFVEVGEITEAIQVADTTIERIKPLVHLHQRDINRYWKIPQYYEVSLELEAVEDSNTSFENLASSLASGWEYQGTGEEKWAVWNPSPSARFFSEAIRWASLEICNHPQAD